MKPIRFEHTDVATLSQLGHLAIMHAGMATLTVILITNLIA